MQTNSDEQINTNKNINVHIKKKWHLWKPALIIKNSEYPMGLCCNEVNAGLVVGERHLFPDDLLSVILILAYWKENHFSDAHHRQFTHLQFSED